MASGFVVLATATPASADPPPGTQCPASYDRTADTADLDGDSEVDVEFTWSTSSSKVDYAIDAGFTVDLCVKSGDDVGGVDIKYVEFPNLTGSDDVDISKDVSHIEWRVSRSEVDPAVPTVDQSVCVAGKPTTPSVDVPADTALIEYDYDSTATGSFDGGVVTATIIDATKVFDDDLPTGWVRVDDDTATFGIDFTSPGTCGGGTTTFVTPAVSFGNPTCELPNSGTFTGANPGSIAYAVISGELDFGETVVVKATPKGIAKFKPGTTDTFEHTFPTAQEAGCVAGTEAIQPVVDFTEASCKNLNGAAFSGMFTDVVDYTVAGDVAPGEAVVVTATIKDSAADQYSFPPGFDNKFEHTFAGVDEDLCPVVEGTQTSKPRPEGEKPPTVLGTQAGVPTAVDAGLTGGPTAGGGSMTALLAQLMVGAGLLLLVAAGWTGLGGRRTRGVHQA